MSLQPLVSYYVVMYIWELINLTIPCQGLELSTMDYIAKSSHSEFTSSYTCKRFDTRWVRERFSDHTTAANPYWTPLARLITCHSRRNTLEKEELVKGLAN